MFGKLSAWFSKDIDNDQNNVVPDTSNRSNVYVKKTRHTLLELLKDQFPHIPPNEVEKVYTECSCNSQTAQTILAKRLPANHDDDVRELRSMFANVPQSSILQVYTETNFNLEKTVNRLEQQQQQQPIPQQSIPSFDITQNEESKSATTGAIHPEHTTSSTDFAQSNSQQEQLEPEPQASPSDLSDMDLPALVKLHSDLHATAACLGSHPSDLSEKAIMDRINVERGINSSLDTIKTILNNKSLGTIDYSSPPEEEDFKTMFESLRGKRAVVQLYFGEVNVARFVELLESLRVQHFVDRTSATVYCVC
ncbi:hypothetical protein P9112_006534 [Eukaryota sp. TZLM1-RC]